MPELPEVETLRQDLAGVVLGARLERVELFQTRMLRGQDPTAIPERLSGGLIHSIGRRGKYLLMHTDRGTTLLIHRGMSGNVLLRDQGDPIERHLHLLLELDDGRQLRVVDPRGFGEIKALTDQELTIKFATLGVEPFGPEFCPGHLRERLAGRRAPVKMLLMGQQIVAGLGNIYSDESLWMAGIHPKREGGSLGPHELSRLHEGVVSSLQDAIIHRGTTFDGAVLDLYGQPGGHHPQVFQPRHDPKQTYPCARCGSALQRLRLSNRGSTFCSKCQPMKKTDSRRVARPLGGRADRRAAGPRATSQTVAL
ncbi:MAG TPA: bifunctional DNA-formamidopyrimidine glycosylase/DNA-(apurinic or apyrimidinic site) lyase [Chloroflexota bacterium]